MASFSSINALSKVLLPALGLPKIFTNPAFMKKLIAASHKPIAKKLRR